MNAIVTRCLLEVITLTDLKCSLWGFSALDSDRDDSSEMGMVGVDEHQSGSDLVSELIGTVRASSRSSRRRRGHSRPPGSRPTRAFRMLEGSIQWRSTGLGMRRS